MRSKYWAMAVWLLVAGFPAGWCAAQPKALAARHHAWGRFQPGAWKLVRIVTETLDAQGLVMSTTMTETKTTLLKVDDDGVVLEVEVGIEVAGKQFDGPPQCIKQGFHGELAGPAVTLKPANGESFEVEIEDRKVPCQVQQVESAGPQRRTVTQVYFTDATSPYILKRHSTTTDTESKTVLSECSLEVLALDIPQKVLRETRPGACVRSVQKNAKGTIVTLAMTAADVPGDVVYHSSKETDTEGRLVRRSILELVAYGLKAEEERTGLFGRKRSARIRKPALHGPTWRTPGAE